MKRSALQRYLEEANKTSKDPGFNPDELVEKHGFKYLGSGCFGRVYTHRQMKGKVVKIGRHRRDPYFKYAVWLRNGKRHAKNPHYPRVEALHKVGAHYVAVIERLKKCSRDDCNFSEARRFAEGTGSGSSIDPSLKKTLAEIRRFKTKIDACVDIHHHNIMKRGTTLVVTDPLS